MHILVLALFVSVSAYAQHSQQPGKEDTSDLRSGFVMFSIENVQNSEGFTLERTPSEDYFLKMKSKSDEKLQKLSSKDAKKLDLDFATKFLKTMYELPASPDGCKALYRLNMKGEGQDICEKDDKKTQEFSSFAHDLKKRF